MIPRLPPPGLDQGLDLGLKVSMGGDHPLGPAGGAAGVEDHGPAPGMNRRQPDGRGALFRNGVADHGHAAPAGHRTDLVRKGAVGDNQVGPGVPDDVFPLRRRMGGAEGNGNAAGLPDSPLGGHLREARGQQEGDSLFPEVPGSLEQSPRPHGPKTAAARGKRNGRPRPGPRSVPDAAGPVAPVLVPWRFPPEKRKLPAGAARRRRRLSGS